MIKKNCLNCEKEFWVRKYREKSAKYCSHKCHTEYSKGKHYSPMTEFKKGEKSAFKKGHKVPEEWRKKLSIALTGRKMSEEARKKMGEARRGEKHFGWIKDRTKLRSRNKHATIEYQQWRLVIFQRDSWTCQKCGQRGGKLQAHHILNFDQYPEIRLDVNNGITFCIKCHKEFHKIYGRKNNTIEQLQEFLSC